MSRRVRTISANSGPKYQSKTQKPTCDFMSFSTNLHLFSLPDNEFYALNLSNCCRHKYGPSISRFLRSNFKQVFDIRPNCVSDTGRDFTFRVEFYSWRKHLNKTNLADIWYWYIAIKFYNVCLNTKTNWHDMILRFYQKKRVFFFK